MYSSTPRAAINMSMLRDEPARAEPMAKNPTQERSTGLRPNIEAKAPHKGMIAVAAKGYALPAQMKSVPCKSSTIVGSVVDTAVYRRVRSVALAILGEPY